MNTNNYRHQGSDISAAVPAFACCGLIFAFFMTFAFTDLPLRWTTLVLVILNALIWLFPIYKEARFGILDLYHPLIFPAALYALPMILVRGTAFAFEVDSFILEITGDVFHFADLGLIVAAVGWLSVVIGFYWAPPSLMNFRFRLPSFLTGDSIFVFPNILLPFLLGLAVNSYMLSAGAYGSQLNPLEESDLPLISVLRPLNEWTNMFLFLAAFVSSRSTKRVWKYFFWSTSAICMSFALVSGSRSAPLWIILIVFAAKCYAVFPSIPKKYFFNLAKVGMVALFIGVILASQFREIRSKTYGETSVSLSEKLDLFEYVFDVTRQEEVGRLLTASLDLLLLRFNSLDLLGLTLARADELQNAERALELDNNIAKSILFGFIPRPLWPEKPLESDHGIKFAQLYMDMPYYTSAGPSMFGDLYRNFGYIGIPIGMFIFGVTLRVIYCNLVLFGVTNPLLPLLYFALLQRISIEGRFTDFYLGGMRCIFGFAFFCIALLVTGSIKRGSSYD